MWYRRDHIMRIIIKKTLISSFIIYKSLYLDKWTLSIESLHLFICIHLVLLTWDRYLVALIPWNLILHQRHFHWLFSKLSICLSSQIDEIELITLIIPKYDGFQLKRWWYFEVEFLCYQVGLPCENTAW